MKIRPYLKNNLTAHGCVAKQFKMVTVSRLALNPNLIFEMASNKILIKNENKF